jgi:FkbM family methyltransferase
VGRYIRASEIKVAGRAEGKIGNLIREGRWYEDKMLLHIKSLELTGCYLDVGANIGNHAMFFALNCHSDHVFAVEAAWGSRSLLNEHLRLNSLEKKVTVVPFAATDRTGPVTFTEVVSDGKTGKPSMTQGIRLDDVIPGGVSVVKLDIEGGEPGALRGMTRILAEDSPRLYIEAHSEAFLDEINGIISPFGYKQTGQVFNASPTYEFAARK